VAKYNQSIAVHNHSAEYIGSQGINQFRFRGFVCFLPVGNYYMCGIAGIFSLEECEEAREAAVRRMCDSMQARGPDAVGYWSDPQAGLSFGHRRLSIIDLDTRAKQPMIADDGRHVIVFNGEIYNFRELRRSLEGRCETFRTQSDTEVLLKLYRHEGEAMLSRLRGMFAFAIWDRQTRSVFLARDPYGIKPLYMARGRHVHRGCSGAGPEGSHLRGGQLPVLGYAQRCAHV
jgi:asparagine synthase (glutamine-hydrolysing)